MFVSSNNLNHTTSAYVKYEYNLENNICELINKANELIKNK